MIFISFIKLIKTYKFYINKKNVCIRRYTWMLLEFPQVIVQSKLAELYSYALLTKTAKFCFIRSKIISLPNSKRFMALNLSSSAVVSAQVQSAFCHFYFLLFFSPSSLCFSNISLCSKFQRN